MAEVVDEGVVRGEIGGVPTYWAPTPGEPTARLTFRVGRADERLPISGITRLAARVVLASVGPRPYRYRSTVDPLTTTFEAQGTPAEVAEFVQRVTGALSDIDVRQFAEQREALDARARRRPRTLAESLLGYRYGPVGVGLAPYPRYGFRWLDAERVRQWVQHYFTAGNAVLSISGPPPSKVVVRLPEGRPLSVPSARSLPIPVPAEVRVGHRGLGFAFVGPHSLDLEVASAVLQRHAERVLLHGGLDRQPVAVQYDRVGPRDAHVAVLIDCEPHSAPAVASYLLGAISDLAGGVPYAEVDRLLDQRWERLTAPEDARPRLEHMVTADLFGDDPEDLYDRLNDLDAESVTTALRTALETAMVLAPEESRTIPGRWNRYPIPSTEPVSGVEYSTRSERGGPATLVVGNEGVSLVRPTAVATVMFQDAAAVVLQGRTVTIWGADGVRIAIDPDQVEAGDQAVAAVRRAVPAHVLVPDGSAMPSAPPARPGAEQPVTNRGTQGGSGAQFLSRSQDRMWLAVSIDLAIVVACLALVIRAEGAGEFLFAAVALIVALAIQAPMFGRAGPGSITTWVRDNRPGPRRR